MRAVLFLAGVLTLAAAPALTQAPAPDPGPAPAPASSYSPPGYNSFADSPYVGPRGVKQCFAIGTVTAANRAGAKTVYLQDRKGVIYRADLPEPCSALDAAQEINVQARGLDVCVGHSALLLVKTVAGTKRCAIREVLRPTKAEITKLAAANPR